MIGDFHFIRPWWLLALLPCLGLLWLIRQREGAAQAWRRIVAPHLLPFLLQGASRHARFSPLLLLAVGWGVSVLALAGPTWRREAAPFADDTAALAIVVKVTPSMTTEDVQPSRLSRGAQKIHDLLALRRGAKTALIAYAGSAHVVMPATTDEGIINTFAQALDPKIMPSDGDAAAQALRLADQTLTRAGSGSILWMTDSIAPDASQALAAWRQQSATPIRLLPPLLPGSELDTLLAQARVMQASSVTLTPDDADIITVAHAAKFAPARAETGGDRWEETGYWLTPLLAALLLPFFRRGWMPEAANRA